MDMLEHILKNTNRELQKQGNYFQYEKVILNFIKKISRNPSRKTIMAYANEMLGTLKGLNEIPLERDAMRYFNFTRWMESEIQMVPYRLLVEKEMKR